MPDPQSALLSGPGRFPALAFYKRKTSQADDIRARAAQLLAEVQQNGLSTERILVTVSPRVLANHPDPLPPHEIEPTDPGDTGFSFEFGAETKIAVMVQVSAETAEDRVHALRLTRAVLEDGGDLELAEELLGDVRADYREPFGYPDNRKGHTDDDIRRAAMIDDGSALDGSSWVFYQRFVHDLSAFFQESDPERNAIMGIDLQGNTHTGAPPSEQGAEGHVKLTRAVNRDANGRPFVVRRGFPFRSAEGKEGLVFIGASNLTTQLKVILQTMLGTTGGSQHDAALKYVEAVNGGLFFVPPSAAWLAKGLNVPGVTIPKEVTAIERPADEALYLYPFTPEGLTYMHRMRDELLLGNPVGRIDPIPNPDDEIASPVSSFALTMAGQIHTQIAGGDPSITGLLPQLDAWVLDINGLPPWKNEAPQKVIDLVDAVSNAAAGGPLDIPKVQAAASSSTNLLALAVQQANSTIASGVGRIPPEVRDLLNGVFHVVNGPTAPDAAMKAALDALLTDSVAASQRVNAGQGYYITIFG